MFRQLRMKGLGRRRAMLRRWKKEVFLTLFMCDLKESVGSMMMPRFLTRGEGVTVTIDAKGEVLGGGDDGFWAEDDNFSFIAIEFEELVVHPGFDVRETVGES